MTPDDLKGFPYGVKKISYRALDRASQAVPPVQHGPHETIDVKAHVMYRISQHITRSGYSSLVDRGVNGGLLGDDATVIFTHQRCVDVHSVDNHELNSLKMVDAYAKTNSQQGPIIIILRQYAYHGVGRTIHSAGQIEYYKNEVSDKSVKVGGTQTIRTVEGYIIPLDMRKGLPHMPMQPATDKEFQTLPHVMLTSGDDWDPEVLDCCVSKDTLWHESPPQDLLPTPFDEHGNYRRRERVTP